MQKISLANFILTRIFFWNFHEKLAEMSEKFKKNRCISRIKILEINLSLYSQPEKDIHKFIKIEYQES